MIKIYVSTLLLITISLATQSQVISVLEKTTFLPIENVMVFNQHQKEYQLSNKAGKFNIDNFNEGDSIFFRHPAYQIKIFTYKKLASLKEIYLQETMVGISEVTVSANKWEQNKSEISQKISTIKPKTIALESPQTAADMLGISGEVFVQKSQLGGGSPMIRGFSTNTVLLVVDGVRLNNAIYRQGNLQNVINLDPNAMDQSEILFGPGSVIYGSDALGGVMNFSTRKPLLSSSDEVLVKGNGIFRYSSANQENMGHIDFIIANQKFSSVTSITYSSYEDLRMGSKNNENEQYLSSHYVLRENQKDSVYENNQPNIQHFSGYNQINLMQKFRYKVNDSVNLNYSFHYSTTSNLPRYDALRQEKNDLPKFAEWYYGPQEWQMHSLSINGISKSTLFDKYKIISAYQNVKESRHARYLNKVDKTEQYESVQIASLNTDFNKKLKQNSELYYGLELIYNGLDSKAQTRNVDTETIGDDWTLPRYPDGDNQYLSTAIYLGYKNRISRKLTLNTGLRYSYTLLRSTFENNYYDDYGFESEFINKNGALNGSIGMAWIPSPTWQVNGNLSSGFHAPNWDGLGKMFAPKKNIIMVPNQNLKPEYAYNAELGLIKYLKQEAISLEGALFYTHVTNPIVEGQFTINGQDSIFYDEEWHQVRASINALYANIYGFNLTLNADLSPYFGLKSYLTYNKGYDSNGDKLRHVPPVFGSTHLLFQLKKLLLDFSSTYHAELNDLAPSERDKDYMYAIDQEGDLYSPSWITFNLKFMYQLSPKIQLISGIENIFDNRYRPYSSGISAPGRNFILSLKGSF